MHLFLSIFYCALQFLFIPPSLPLPVLNHCYQVRLVSRSVSHCDFDKRCLVPRQGQG